MQFRKPPLTTADHLIRLQTKGLTVSNQALAERALSRIGYYRLLVYMRPFQDAQKQFRPGTDFQHIIQLYEFDRELRLLCLDAIDRIEVALRAAIVNNLTCILGSHFHTDVSVFGYFGYFHNFWKQGFRAKSTAITHYRSRYKDPKEPPIWVLLEALTFGTLSTFFADLAIAHRKTVSRNFSFSEKILVSWFRSLTLLRNKCAHHNRVWNATYNTNAPVVPKHLTTAFGGTNTFQAKALMIYCLLKQLDGVMANNWRSDLQALLATYSQVIDLQAMGFAQNDPLWTLN